VSQDINMRMRINIKEMIKMAMAFIQIGVEPGKEEEVKKSLKNLNYLSCKIEEAYLTYGEFDVVMKISSDATENINHFIMALRKVKGIRRTVTSLVIGTI